MALLLYLGCVLRPPMFSLINGSGNARLNLAVALLDGVVMRIGFALFLGVTCGMGIRGFWYGDAFSAGSKKRDPERRIALPAQRFSIIPRGQTLYYARRAE